MGLSCQPMENVQLRNHFKMQPQMTGVLVSKINPLSDAHGVLKKDDIILEFDGVIIANDGTGTCFYTLLIIFFLKVDSIQHFGNEHFESNINNKNQLYFHIK